MRDGIRDSGLGIRENKYAERSLETKSEVVEDER
jgi:hypothetical protein